MLKSLAIVIANGMLWIDVLWIKYDNTPCCAQASFSINGINFIDIFTSYKTYILLGWIGLSSVLRPFQHRLYGTRFLQVKRPNQQHQSTEGTYSTQRNQTHNKQTWTQNTASPLVYTNMGWLGMAPTEDRVARPERRWGCCRGTPHILQGTIIISLKLQNLMVQKLL